MRSREPSRMLLWGALLLLLGMAAQGVAEAAEPTAAEREARAVCQQIIDDVMAVLSDKSLPEREKVARIETIAYRHFQFETISRLVLGRNWKRFTPEQREAFILEFKRHISVSYGHSLDDYGDETVEITATRAERNRYGDVTVRSKIYGASAEPILVDYRMRPEGEDWFVIDVIIEQTSMLHNFRSQTQEIISKDGPQGLIDRLHEKNEAHEDSL